MFLKRAWYLVGNKLVRNKYSACSLCTSLAISGVLRCCSYLSTNVKSLFQTFMAQFNINDGSSGRVGNVITYQMYGKSYMRSLPGQYKDKKSEKQLVQRQKMQLVNAFLGPYKDVLRITFQKEAVGRSAFMAAKSYNLLNAIGGVYPEQYLDYTNARVSRGSVPLPAEASVERTEDGVLFKWNDNGLGYGSDTLLVIAGLHSQYATRYKQTGGERRDGSYLWKVKLSEVEQYDFWLVFRDYKERDFSNSMWLGLK
ncbi:hypothetical protein J1N10_09585 [Carboxylicivirga sp. A043]|uniref:DUF6266 family protein n=1 Tax=Carboxylicivirga litoralis TaxID=2816963 RepID=UPI0021CB3A77|nr:DUF6266 family protein [Carboxylicivirga sp. A043]MCU4156228.1 hypothetical protein [Carboxylicivirga sp. A043]